MMDKKVSIKNVKHMSISVIEFKEAVLEVFTGDLFFQRTYYPSARITHVHMCKSLDKSREKL